MFKEIKTIRYEIMRLWIVDLIDLQFKLDKGSCGHALGAKK